MVRCSAIGLAAALMTIGPSIMAQQPTNDNSNNPKTAVAAVRLENGYRASKIIGASVYNEQNQKIGSISDLYLSKAGLYRFRLTSFRSTKGARQ